MRTRGQRSVVDPRVKVLHRPARLERSQREEARMDAMQQEAANSEDFKEATRSFIEKRKPVCFTGADRGVRAGQQDRGHRQHWPALGRSGIAVKDAAL